MQVDDLVRSKLTGAVGTIVAFADEFPEVEFDGWGFSFLYNASDLEVIL